MGTKMRNQATRKLNARVCIGATTSSSTHETIESEDRKQSLLGALRTIKTTMQASWRSIWAELRSDLIRKTTKRSTRDKIPRKYGSTSAK